jgi:hypothetical protein
MRLTGRAARSTTRIVARASRRGPYDGVGFVARCHAIRGTMHVVDMRHVYAVIFMTCGVVGVAYGLLDVFVPSVTIRWQVRSIAKGGTGGNGSTVGAFFQKQLAIDPRIDAGNDPVAKKKVRRLRVALIAISVLMVVAGVWLWRS